MSLPVMSLGLRFCTSKKGEIGAGVWLHPKGANSATALGLAIERYWVGHFSPHLHEWA